MEEPSPSYGGCKNEVKKPCSASNLVIWQGLTLPVKITKAIEFEQSILSIRSAYTGVQEGNERFLNLMYYLLGWLVGDAGKNFSPVKPWARVELDLSRKHPENLQLGNFVMSCISSLGIPSRRIADRSPGKRDSFGLYRWMSYFSEVVAWLHTSCLGLDRRQLTSYNPVKMNWLLSAPPERILWFLRGVADSDGTVNLRNRTVEITSQPNAPLFSRLFSCIGIACTTYTTDGVGYVSISAVDAWKLRIFNPIVKTHRDSILNRLANARTHPRHWPAWLETSVNQMLLQGLGPSDMRNILLKDKGVYVKLSTLKKRQRMFEIGAGGGPNAH